ncbi:MAG: PKD domain-containing protein [Kiritimatiellae bacterium]|nr:PKD domain-containing protein [Kiritimatiellia bacterium]
MKRSPWAKAALSCAFALVSATAVATDYYVSAESGASDNNDGLSAESPFATVDKAIASAANASDVIHVAAGTYATTAQWGPNLKAKLIGTGASRDDVVIESAGTYRTLRMAAGSWLENVTVVGEGTKKADKGGAVEVNGGTITNCVFRDGYTTGNNDNLEGGNLYIGNASALVVDSLIQNGHATKRGGNVYLNGGTVRNCTIEGGTCDNVGGNVFIQNGNLENCVVSDSSSTKEGGGIYIQAGSISGSTISNGSGTEGGAIRMTGGTITNSTILANGVTRGSGGGVYMSGGTVTGCLIDGEGGTMSWHGGCIYMKNGTVRNTVCTNGVCTYASTREGGNIYMENGTLENVTLADGRCAQDGGNLRMTGGSATGLVCTGGIAGRNGGNICAQGSATIGDSSLSEGSAENVGGNLHAYGSAAIDNCEIADGVSKSDGGNIRIGDSVVVRDSTISGGTVVTDAEKKGANVYMDGSAKLIRCHMSGGTSFSADGETAGYDRGSVCAYSATTLIQDCLVEGSSCGGILLGTTGNLYGTTVADNNKYGIWSWRALQVFQNCVIFGNYNGDRSVPKEYSGNQPSGEGSAFLNCAMAADTLSTDTYPTLVTISAADFADYANGDYRPAATGALVDAGATDERVDASTVDLDGNPRLSDLVDIGCYEYQHTDMTVSFTAPVLDTGYAPARATFTASAENAPGDVTYEVDFGDGTFEEWVPADISHVYRVSGTFTITVVAKSGAERSHPMTRTLKLVERYLWVGAGAYATIQDAVDEAVDGCEVILNAGTYEVTSPVVVNKAVTVRAEGTAVVRNTVEATSGSTNHRVMEISGGALVTGLVIENGSVFNGYGGCIDVSAATVSNCVIRGGIVTRGDTGNVGGGGVSLRSNAVLTHCRVTGNTVVGTSTGNGDNAGGAIFVHNNNKPVRILNTLVAGNRYICTEGAAAKSGSAGILFGGANENSLVENCTIAGNTVEGALSNDSAGLHCTSWSATFRNNVIAGNFETAKGENGTYTSAKIDTAHCTVTHCATDDATPLNANCFVASRDAMFKGFARGDYRPVNPGALIDCGTTPAVAAEVDLLGNPRVKFHGIDVGCYECQSLPRTIFIVR